jgi:integrase
MARHGTTNAYSAALWTPALHRLGIRYRHRCNMRHTYAKTMLMAGLHHAFCARQPGHSIEVLLTTCARWIGIEDEKQMRLRRIFPQFFPGGVTAHEQVK